MMEESIVSSCEDLQQPWHEQIRIFTGRKAPISKLMSANGRLNQSAAPHHIHPVHHFHLSRMSPFQRWLSKLSHSQNPSPRYSRFHSILGRPKLTSSATESPLALR